MVLLIGMKKFILVSFLVFSLVMVMLIIWFDLFSKGLLLLFGRIVILFCRKFRLCILCILLRMLCVSVVLKVLFSGEFSVYIFLLMFGLFMCSGIGCIFGVLVLSSVMLCVVLICMILVSSFCLVGRCICIMCVCLIICWLVSSQLELLMQKLVLELCLVSIVIIVECNFGIILVILLLFCLVGWLLMVSGLFVGMVFGVCVMLLLVLLIVVVVMLLQGDCSVSVK